MNTPFCVECGEPFENAPVVATRDKYWKELCIICCTHVLKEANAYSKSCRDVNMAFVAYMVGYIAAQKKHW